MSKYEVSREVACDQQIESIEKEVRALDGKMKTKRKRLEKEGRTEGQIKKELAELAMGIDLMMKMIEEAKRIKKSGFASDRG